MARPATTNPALLKVLAGWQDEGVASGLAEPVAAADVRAEPAVDRGQPEQAHRDDRDGARERERSQVPLLVRWHDASMPSAQPAVAAGRSRLSRPGRGQVGRAAADARR